MNPDYLLLTGSLQLLTMFVIGPAIAIAIASAAWRGKPNSFNPERYGMLCVASGVTALLLFGFAKWLNADFRTAEYLLQVVCVLLGGLLFGVCMGCGFSVMLRMWRWHKTTRMTRSRTTDESETRKN
jgi:hypothetical protein